MIVRDAPRPPVAEREALLPLEVRVNAAAEHVRAPVAHAGGLRATQPAVDHHGDLVHGLDIEDDAARAVRHGAHARVRDVGLRAQQPLRLRLLEIGAGASDVQQEEGCDRRFARRALLDDLLHDVARPRWGGPDRRGGTRIELARAHDHPLAGDGARRGVAWGLLRGGALPAQERDGNCGVEEQSERSNAHVSSGGSRRG
jgi:hypothetical protein